MSSGYVLYETTVQISGAPGLRLQRLWKRSRREVGLLCATSVPFIYEVLGFLFIKVILRL